MKIKTILLVLLGGATVALHAMEGGKEEESPFEKVPPEIMLEIAEWIKADPKSQAYATGVFEGFEKYKKDVGAARKALQKMRKEAELRSLRFALIRAVKAGDLEKVKDLLKSKIDLIDLNAQDELGATALMYAASSSPEVAEDMVKVLLASGADPLVKNKEGKMAYDYAIESRDSASPYEGYDLYQKIVDMIRFAEISIPEPPPPSTK